jgi:hypothetical protein
VDKSVAGKRREGEARLRNGLRRRMADLLVRHRGSIGVADDLAGANGEPRIGHERLSPSFHRYEELDELTALLGAVIHYAPILPGGVDNRTVERMAITRQYGQVL